MQEGSTSENSAEPGYLTDGGRDALDKLRELLSTSDQLLSNGNNPGLNDFERDARAALHVLTMAEEMGASELATQRDYLCELLHYASMTMEHYRMYIFAGRLAEKILEINPNYFPIDVDTQITDEAPVQPEDNPLLEVPDL